MEFAITQILDDQRAAEEVMHFYERRYSLSTTEFYALYQQGRMDNGKHAEEFAEWSASYKLKQKRQAALK